jgi:hypothetical protein
MEMLSAVRLCSKVSLIDTPRNLMFGQYTLIKSPKPVIFKVQGDYLNVYSNINRMLNGPSESSLFFSKLVVETDSKVLVQEMAKY